MTDLERVEAMAGRAYGMRDVDRTALLAVIADYLAQRDRLLLLVARVGELEVELEDLSG